MINAKFKFMENDEPIKFQIKDGSNKIEKMKEKEAQKLRIIQVLDIPLNYKLYEIRASREDRYGYALKLTGLPFGTTGKELTELLKRSGAKSVVIPRNPKNYNLLKYAMVYFPNEDVLTEAASLELKIKGSVLFWLNLDEKLVTRAAPLNILPKITTKNNKLNPNT
ncbi:unnamed protein product [Rhizophagus irregularis]|nr:unnamed protein product [Rhizophagus irregularis]